MKTTVTIHMTRESAKAYRAGMDALIAKRRADDPNWPHGAHDTPRPKPEEKEAA